MGSYRSPHRHIASIIAVVALASLLGCGSDSAPESRSASETASATPPGSPAPPATAPRSPPVQLSAGDGFSCARLRDGRVMCWGVNADHQLGTSAVESSAVAIEVAGVPDAKELTSGSSHSCIRHGDGRISCWGLNSAHQISPNAPPTSARPVDVEFAEQLATLAAGGNQTCGVQTDGLIKCWGEPGYFVGDELSFPKPSKFEGGFNVIRIDAGSGRTCATRRDGSALCWGLWRLPGGKELRRKPEVIPALSAASDLALGRDHVCAVDDGGGVRCWSNELGPVAKRTSTPRLLAALKNVSTIVAGSRFSCAIDGDGAVWCWTVGGKPGVVAGVTAAESLVAGAAHACVLASGQVRCWSADAWRPGGAAPPPGVTSAPGLIEGL